MKYPDGSTELLALFGADLSRSPSPMTHTRWAEQSGLNWVYLAMPCQSENEFLQLASCLMQSSQFRGANITNPFKRTALKLPGVSLDPSAEACGAANTLYRSEHAARPQWRLANTDLVGCSDTIARILREELKEPGNLTRLQVVILGAGAMADTCAAAARHFKQSRIEPEITQIGRQDLQSDTFVATLSQEQRAPRILINTLPTGTSPTADALACRFIERLSPISRADRHAFFEVSYCETRCLSLARTLGWDVYRGTELFELQARASFKLWAHHNDSIQPNAQPPVGE